MSPSRRKGGSPGRRSEAAAGADGAGSRCANKEAGPRSGASQGLAGRGGGPGGYPGRSRDRDVARPARRRRCGKARTRPPDASFRKTVCAERSVFVETVFLSAHPGEGPGAPPRLPLNLPRRRGGARPLACVIPGKPARKGGLIRADSAARTPVPNPRSHCEAPCRKPVHPVPTPGQRCHPANAPG